MTDPWPQIAIVGAGAVGCYFGGMLARAGAPVTLIGRARHVDAIHQRGLLLDSIHFRETISVNASTDLENVRSAEVVLLCVKTPQTEEAARSFAPYLAEGAVIVSLQNGVDNVERIRSSTGREAIAAVVYVAAEMVGPGSLKHTGRGDLVFGDVSNQKDPRGQRRLDDLAALFGRAHIPCRISENIQADLWTKLVLNCAYNAISALGRSDYRRMIEHPPTRELMSQVVEEVADVARASGVNMGNLDVLEVTWKLAKTMPQATSSTAQDIARGRRTEIDSLNGYIVRRGEELGVATPVNQSLYALVKLLEEAASRPTV